jgi:hypothetical protein
MKFLENWGESLIQSRSLALTKSVRVEGLRKAHLGPRMDFARVEFVVEPADEFSVAVEVPNLDVTAEQQTFLEWAMFGFLDVVMMTEPYPTKSIRLTVTSAEFDPVSSNMVAFRLAGRDAGRKFVEEIGRTTRPRP